MSSEDSNIHTKKNNDNNINYAGITGTDVGITLSWKCRVVVSIRDESKVFFQIKTLNEFLCNTSLAKSRQRNVAKKFARFFCLPNRE